ncbi:chromate efflux transporter [Parvibaculum sp.]|uniref:chromate efflux transporter n=1 Tax=Parvibaculum sp. TaxID=2024848 RepID=UPI000C8CA92E|nr:chromate efflux transporter [Parvibaculum sp.]MAB14747.1 chromate transporter [Parvibaculum sp.]
MTEKAAQGTIGEVFSTFLKLGLTSFGGPVAHLGYFRAEIVEKRGWLDDRAYADLVALCQFLPGPASSQVGMGLGLMRAGAGGMLAAWLAFTLPSAIALMFAAFGAAALEGDIGQGVLSGLKIVAVAVVAQAVLQMARNLAPDAPRATLAVAAAVAMLIMPSTLIQLAVLAGAALIGLVVLKPEKIEDWPPLAAPVSPVVSILCLALFFGLLAGLPLLAQGGEPLLRLADIFYRAGALVFGGGHVVLPLLEADLVPRGLISQDNFLAGYGMAQAVPGPLFTFSAYVGAAVNDVARPVLAAAVCLVAMFLPSFLLVPGVLPFWSKLSRFTAARAALMGVNAGVVGLLAAALYMPVFTSAISGGAEAALALGAWMALAIWKLPPWAVVVASAAIGGVAL